MRSKKDILTEYNTVLTIRKEQNRDDQAGFYYCIGLLADIRDLLHEIKIAGGNHA